jgi:hypothetical protein
VNRGQGPPGEVRAPNREAGRGAEDRRLAGGASVAIFAHTDDETLCSMCLRRPRVGRWDWCRACLLDLVTGLRRRRDAADRCEPMADGRRDTLEPRRAS